MIKSLIALEMKARWHKMSFVDSIGLEGAVSRYTRLLTYCFRAVGHLEARRPHPSHSKGDEGALRDYRLEEAFVRNSAYHAAHSASTRPRVAS